MASVKRCAPMEPAGRAYDRAAGCWRIQCVEAALLAHAERAGCCCSARQAAAGRRWSDKCTGAAPNRCRSRAASAAPASSALCALAAGPQWCPCVCAARAPQLVEVQQVCDPTQADRFATEATSGRMDVKITSRARRGVRGVPPSARPLDVLVASVRASQSAAARRRAFKKPSQCVCVCVSVMSV